MTEMEQRAIVSGIGQSQVGRRIYRDELELTVEACLEAIGDAGLTPEDIDGLASYPGEMRVPAGFSGPGTPEVQDTLRLDLNWHRAGMEGAAQLAAVIDACIAVSAGLARHVLVYRTVTEASAQGAGGREGIGGGQVARQTGMFQWLLPYAALSAANWTAWHAQRYFHEYGATREQLAGIALNARRHAGLNPKAIYRDPMTLEDYLAARMISTPLGLYDCDVPADGSTAFIISHVDHAADAPNPVAQVQAVGTAIKGRPYWDQWEDLTTMAARDAGTHMWSRTDLRPADVDVAGLYDGFSFLTLVWLEALGFCDRGEGAAFVEDPKRIGFDGDLPLNTNGGQLSAGRLHGFGFLHEVMLQLRGDAGDRQVPGGCEVGVVANGGGNLAGCMLLTRVN
jgi:acetyl-CoA acetyltransferase